MDRPMSRLRRADPGGTHELFMVFKVGSGDLFTFDDFTVNG